MFVEKAIFSMVFIKWVESLMYDGRSLMWLDGSEKV